MTMLVYAYGCHAPLAGEDDARQEMRRSAVLWDRLVEIDRDIARQELTQARADDIGLDQLCEQIDRLSELLIQNPDDKTTRFERRKGFAQRRERLNLWRKTHRQAVRALDQARIARVVAARQADQDDPDGLYWGTRNRLLRSYDTGRQVARRKGRLLRPHEEGRDEAVLAVQLQRTPTGLGAAPGEVIGGKFSTLHITVPDPYGYCKVSMRVDRAGHELELPLLLHRPLPQRCRVKAAEIVLRHYQGRDRWRLCLSLDVSECGLFAPMRHAVTAARVDFDWADRGELEVMRIGPKLWRLPLDWVQRLDRIERRCSQLDALLNQSREAWGQDERMGPILAISMWDELLSTLAQRRDELTHAQRQWGADALRLRRQISGERAHALGFRGQLYTAWAREVVSTYPSLQLDDRDLSVIATRERGEPDNAQRHRAAVHLLRMEIQHQARKAGTPIVDASGQVLNAPDQAKSNSWARRKAGKAKRSQERAQDPDRSDQLS